MTTARDPLGEAEIEAWAAAHPGWSAGSAALVREVHCPSFPAAIELVNRVAEHAERVDHHPDIDIRWRTVRFALWTHTAGAVTRLDLQLAAEIDRICADLR